MKDIPGMNLKYIVEVEDDTENSIYRATAKIGYNKSDGTFYTIETLCYIWKNASQSDYPEMRYSLLSDEAKNAYDNHKTALSSNSIEDIMLPIVENHMENL